MGWHGKYFKGAMKQRRQMKRDEAEHRQFLAVRSAHPDGECDCDVKGLHRIPPSDQSAETLLKEIFENGALSDEAILATFD